MLHKKRVLRAVYYATRRRVRIALKRPGRTAPPPVLSQSLDAIVDRHGRIARSLLENIPVGLDLTGKNVCEVGAGDCLAGVGLMLGLGAGHADVVEIADPVVNQKQRETLTFLKKQGLPIDVTFIEGQSEPLTLNADRVQFHKAYMENLENAKPIDFLYSFSVMEHVEDLDGFYRASAKVMRPGAHMLHVVDLGGHCEFEDPLPPLDFQTYPDWLYDYIYPPYNRATRTFLNEHLSAIERNGFKILKMNPFRTVTEEYVNNIWGQLRPAARSRPRKEIAVIEFAVVAQKI
jgi:hypothetical protein